MLVPFGVVTVTGTAPILLPAGAVTVTEVAVRAVTVALAVPNCTEVAEARSVPVMTTVSPPPRSPTDGLSPVTDGQPPAGAREVISESALGVPHPVALS